MLREHRSRDKLKAYYRKFVTEGIMDANVHPWVAESWRKSKSLDIERTRMGAVQRMPEEDFRALQEKHASAIDYLAELTHETREFFQEYNISLLLIDSDCRVLKSYSHPFYQKSPGEIEGARLGIEEIGTSSISIAREHQTPFLIFGPEMWLTAYQNGDACSAPVMVDGKLSFILTLVTVDGEVSKELSQDAVLAQLFVLCRALERHLASAARLMAAEAILDATPFAVYHILSDSAVTYANRLGHARLSGIAVEHEANEEHPHLGDVVMNYEHTPIKKGFSGVPSYNKECTWITAKKTYEDIMTVVPMGKTGAVDSVVVVSMPIEDLRTLVAHAAGYTAKYSLRSMVGNSTAFCSVRQKAVRIAKNKNHVLLQGESGTGKKRMARGIHQASPRVAGPMISLCCGDMAAELLEQELFGVMCAPDISRPGRLELASGGTLFLDEIEKMPLSLGHALAKALLAGKSCRLGERAAHSIDVRILAACDSDLKRLTERGLFAEELYQLLSKSVIRVPSLRGRREDIPLLAANIISELAAQHQMMPKQLTPEAEKKLTDYNWPGNIKQLQSVLEYAFFHTENAAIDADAIHLMGGVRLDSKWKEDREIFIKAWKAAGGNVSRLAGLLHVSRVTLYRYLKKFGLGRK